MVKIDIQSPFNFNGPKRDWSQIDWSNAMDMALDVRALRSLFMCELDDLQVGQVQAHEKELANRYGLDMTPRFMYISEMMKLTGCQSTFKCSSDQFEKIIKWFSTVRPRRKDVEIDGNVNGLDFHHAWDWNSRKKGFPELSEKFNAANEIKRG